MIHRIYSSLPSFKSLEFHSGLNLVLAEKTPGATERQTRNRAGKSSITEIIHFLMAGTLEKNSIFRDAHLKNHSFGLEFDLGGHMVAMEREAENRSVLTVAGGEYNHWPVQPSVDTLTGKKMIKNSLWKIVLGKILFELPESEEKYGPTFRSLFSYFVRRQSVRGFTDPFRQNEKQQPYDQQVAISYLIGLDWTIPQKWQSIREQEKSLKALKKAAREGALGDIISTTSDLRTKLTVAEARAEQLRRSTAEFKVLPEYRELEQKASDLTRQINRLVDENTMDLQLIDDIEESLQEEAPPPDTKLEEVYREAGVVLPALALKRFEDVRAFHQSVLANRHSYLQGEIDASRRRIEHREDTIKKHEVRRSQIMGILQSHGALDHFARLQEELARLETDVENLRQRYATAEKLETGKTDLVLERQQLLRRLRQDHNEQSDILRMAILAFEEISNALYEDAGSLVISESLNGPLFEVKIHGKRSSGVSNVQVFCFDMMLMRFCAERGIGPGFLFHDSHLFDGVDERQVAKALQLGAKLADSLGFQYIVTMNEDALPTELPKDFDLEQYIMPTRLTDATEDGGLFGIRFG
jgi:uncharacterized protein YydD (DUF2326 family)